MSETSDYEDLRRYLLGQQPEEEADRLERRLLLDEDLFELAEATEADLLDECARGELAPALCEPLTRRLAASPGGRVRLTRARSLTVAVAATPAVPAMTDRPAPVPVLPFRRPGLLSRPAVRVALAAGLAGLIVFAWQVERTLQPRAPQTIAQAAPPDVLRGTTPAPAPALPISPQNPPSTPPQPAAPAAPALPPVRAEKPRARRAPAAAVLVLQVAMTTRGDEEESPNVLHIVSPDQPIEIQLKLEEGEPYSSYEVSIGREEDGQAVWTWSGLTPASGSRLKIRPPARDLADGSYLVTLKGVTPEGTSEAVGYPRFRVVRP
jgi:hypothetical protein